MSGKDKCKILKEIRKQIADSNDIPYVVEECPHKGDCTGTCPRCEEELLYLERELAKRKKTKLAVAAGGAAAAVLLAAAAKPYINDFVRDYFTDTVVSGAVDPIAYVESYEPEQW